MSTKNSNRNFDRIVDSLYNKSLKSLGNGSFRVNNFTKSNIIHKYLQQYECGIETDMIYFILLIRLKEYSKLFIFYKILINTILLTPLKIFTNKSKQKEEKSVTSNRKVRVILVSILNSL